MVMIPERKGTKITIESLEYGGDKPSPYLGMSSSGEECLRKRFYGFHWCALKKHSALKERTFNLGHEFEKIIIQQLKDAGMEVFRRDKNGEKIELKGHKKEKQEEVIGFAGHEKGHSDGRTLGVIEAPKTEHLLEIKTMQQKYFLPLVKKGVREAKPEYYDQMQRYMKAKKLTRALFITINKNTSESHIERVDFNPTRAEILCKQAQSVIMSTEPPARGYPAGFYKCGYCSYKEICRENEVPLRNYRGESDRFLFSNLEW